MFRWGESGDGFCWDGGCCGGMRDWVVLVVAIVAVD